MTMGIELDLSAFSEPAPTPAAAPPPPRFEPELELAEEVPEESGEDLDFITEHLTEAEVFAKYGLAEKAAEHLRAVIERAPKHAAAHDKLFRILLDEGDVAGARAAATQYIALLDERGDSETAEAVRDEFSARGQSLAPSARPAPPPVAPPPVTPVAPPPQPAEEEISFDLDSGAAEFDFAEPALEIAAEEPAMLVAEEVVEDIAFDLPTAEEITFEETPEITFEEPAPPVEEPPVFDAFSFEPQAPTPEDIGEVDFYIEQELFEEARTKLAALSARFPGDASPARARASPSNTIKRHSVSLPWSGTRARMVRMVSSSSAVGPGPLISRGLTERRIFRSSRASGTRVSFVGMAVPEIGAQPVQRKRI